MKGFLLPPPPLLLVQIFRKICQQWGCKFMFHVIPCQSWTKSKKCFFFTTMDSSSIQALCFLMRMVCLTKPENRKGTEEMGKKSTIHFPHDDSPFSTQHACEWHYLHGFGNQNQQIFLSHDESKLCLSFIIVATPTVKLYYSCVKTSSNLKIGHEAAKKPTHSVTLILYLKEKFNWCILDANIILSDV